MHIGTWTSLTWWPMIFMERGREWQDTIALCLRTPKTLDTMFMQTLWVLGLFFLLAFRIFFFTCLFLINNLIIHFSFRFVWREIRDQKEAVTVEWRRLFLTALTFFHNYSSYNFQPTCWRYEMAIDKHVMQHLFWKNEASEMSNGRTTLIFKGQ